MIGGKYYRNINTKEIVLEEDAKDYVLDKLGITITPKGKNGEYILEQLEMLDTIVEWYFSDWEEIEEYEDEGNVFELIAEENYYDNKLFN